METAELNPPAKKFTANPTNTLETRILFDVLVEVNVGGQITYDDLSEAVGRNVQTVAAYALRKARNLAIDERQIVFGVNRGVGLVRLDNAGILKTGDKYLRHISRTVKTGVKTATCVDLAPCTDDQKRKHHALLTSLGVMKLFGSQRGLKKIEEACTTSQPLALGKTLELFKGQQT